LILKNINDRHLDQNQHKDDITSALPGSEAVFNNFKEDEIKMRREVGEL